MEIKRREFLGGIAAGSAVLTMPAFLAGCGVNKAITTATPPPANPFLEWFGVDPATVSRVMAELTANGADAADLYFQHQRSNFIGMEDGLVSRANSEILQGVGLRVVVGDQTGYAFTEDLALPSMLAAARTAAAIARGSQVVAPQAFNHKQSGDLYKTQVPWEDVGVAEKLPILQRVDRQARQADPSIEKVSVYWADADERVLIATLDGHIVTDHRPMTRLSAQVTATREGETQSGFSNIAARESFGWYTDERVDAMVKEAVDRTLILFEAVRPPAGEMPVILAAGPSGILLHEAIGHGLEADFNRKGTSIYSDMMGKQVAEPFVTVVDQATLPGERGALNYDDEGNACGRTVLVENGILRSYLHDSISASQYEVPVTGSGRRESYRFAPMPRMTCTFMEDGPHTKDEIVAAVDRGIIAETYTNGQVQIGAGDYTFYVKNGWLVEKGKITAPIKDVNIIGNGPESLKRITMVANDARLDTGGWTCGKNGQRVPVSQGIPTVLVSKMTVGGENAA
jgi:TldD protein